MRLLNLEKLPLAEDELLLKEKYMTSDHKYWEKPMTLAEYEHYMAEGKLLQTPTSHYYRDKSKDGIGITIGKVPGDSNISITLHSRYGYPVLHNHEYVEIIYVAAGCCTNFLETTSFPLNTGDVCIMAPDSLHTPVCTDEHSCIINIMVNRDFFNRTFLGILRGGKVLISFLENILYHHPASPYILFPTGNDQWLKELGRHMVSEVWEKPHAYEHSVKLLASEFLLHLVREYEVLAVVPGATNNEQDDLTVAVLGYLSVNYHRATLGQTADFFGYSPSYLSRMIKNNTGKTYNTIVTELQMERAVEMLCNGERNLTAIAQEVGCFDSSHFNKKFKSVFGVTPKQYIAAFRQT